MDNSRPAVLFDVDGTLVDANYLHTIAWWRGLRDCGEQVPMSRIHPLIGMGSDQLVERLLGHELEGASDAHARHYGPLKEELVAFPGADELLREVNRRGALVVLATSSKEEDVARLCEVIGAGDAVDHVVSKGDVEHSKPAPDIFAAAMDHLGLDPSRAVVVGDTVWDVEAAGKLGVECLCVLTGGHAREQLQAAGSVAVYDDVGEILANLDDTPIGALLAR